LLLNRSLGKGESGIPLLMQGTKLPGVPKQQTLNSLPYLRHESIPSITVTMFCAPVYPPTPPHPVSSSKPVSICMSNPVKHLDIL
jgi:hypothetical protein